MFIHRLNEYILGFRVNIQVTFFSYYVKTSPSERRDYLIVLYHFGFLYLFFTISYEFRVSS